MIILGIETSCDETAASVVRDGKQILSNVVASSVELHAKTGGVIPENAAREQVKSIIPVIQETIENCKLKIENLDTIAVTTGPGLIGSLLVGVETAKTLSYVWNKPIIPVNHVFAHIYANWLASPTASGQRPTSSSRRPKLGEGGLNIPKFPAIALVVSGGHTDLVLMQDHNKLEWIGGTRDDAAGEVFDKTARLLGLGFPGGPAIAAAAAKYESGIMNYESGIKLPRPLINENTFDFSFSGLKTAVLREAQKPPTYPTPLIAYEVQESITDVLVDKTLKAVEKYKPKSLLLAGGVAANERLREKMQLAIQSCSHVAMYAPPVHLCTDNAAMVAAAGEFTGKPVDWRKITANPSLTILD